MKNSFKDVVQLSQFLGAKVKATKSVHAQGIKR